MASSPISSPRSPISTSLPPSSSSQSSTDRLIFRRSAINEPPPSTEYTSLGNTAPSMADQLRSLTLSPLKQTPPLPLFPSNSIATWFNPSKPKPSILLPHRHPRSPLSRNPNLHPLSLASSSEDFDTAFPDHLPDPSALSILNALRPWRKSHLFFIWLQSKSPSPLDTVFYNVVLKSLRTGQQFPLAESLAGEMIRLGVPLDNITFSTLITCAKRCRYYERAIYWFDQVYQSGLLPDEVTYSAIIDVYAQIGRREDAVALYERARAGGWVPDHVAFSVLSKMFGEARDYDGIEYVLKEMKTLCVKPNTVVYNSLLDALGKAGKPVHARNLFEEMLASGLPPNEKTLTAMIKIYGRNMWERDALELCAKIRENKWPVDLIMYNTLLSMCANIGLEGDAEKLFDEMQQWRRGKGKLDAFSYTAMINLYSRTGKSDRALKMFDEMLSKGVEPNVMGCTCLIQCLGKDGRIEDAMRIFDIAMEKGIRCDDRLCCCLLSLMAFCAESDIIKVVTCLEKARPGLVRLVEMLGKEETQFEEVKEELKGNLNELAVDVRRPFCNCLIDICRNRAYPSRRAHEILHLGTMYGLYSGLHTKLGSKEWCLNMRTLSIGAAYTAFEGWMEALFNLVEHEEELPLIFSVQTGSMACRLSLGISSTFSSYLEISDAPFRQNGENGYFIAVKDDLISWLRSKVNQEF